MPACPAGQLGPGAQLPQACMGMRLAGVPGCRGTPAPQPQDPSLLPQGHREAQPAGAGLLPWQGRGTRGSGAQLPAAQHLRGPQVGAADHQAGQLRLCQAGRWGCETPAVPHPGGWAWVGPSSPQTTTAPQLVCARADARSRGAALLRAELHARALISICLHDDSCEGPASSRRSLRGKALFSWGCLLG